MEYHDVPGYLEAIERENAIRNAAYLDLPECISDIEVNPLTARLWVALEGIGSPFAVGGIPTPEEVARFLWCVSTDYVAGCKEARESFKWRIRNVSFALTRFSIQKYIRDAFQDAPPGSEDRRVPYAGSTSGLVDLLASEYGWDEQSILDLPLKRAFQYARRIQRRHDPKCILFNPSDQVTADWLKTLNEKKPDGV